MNKSVDRYQRIIREMTTSKLIAEKEEFELSIIGIHHLLSSDRTNSSIDRPLCRVILAEDEYLLDLIKQELKRRDKGEEDAV